MMFQKEKGHFVKIIKRHKFYITLIITVGFV